MIPVYSTVPHKPEEGLYGDCHRACVASVLELPSEAVPHFFAKGPEEVEAAWKEHRAFLWQRGVMTLDIPWIVTEEQGFKAVLASADIRSQARLWYILGGESETGCGHSVVCRGDRIVHNPTWNEPKIVGPMDDGYYWTSFFVAPLDSEIWW